MDVRIEKRGNKIHLRRGAASGVMMAIGIFSVAAHTSIVRCFMLSVTLTLDHNSFQFDWLRRYTLWTNSGMLI